MSYLDEQKFKRNAVHSVDLVLKVKHVDKVVVIGRLFLLGDTLGKDLRVLIQVEHRLITSWLAIESVGACFVHPYPAAFGLVGDLGLFHQGLYQVLDCSRLGYKEVELFLITS